MKDFKEYLKTNGTDYYHKLLATKIVDKLEVFITNSVSKTELINIVTDVINKHLSK